MASICEPCPANAVRQSDSQAWVGCFGLMPVSNIVLPDLVDEVPVGTVDLREQLGLLLTQQPIWKRVSALVFPERPPNGTDCGFHESLPSSNDRFNFKWLMNYLKSFPVR